MACAYRKSMLKSSCSENDRPSCDSRLNRFYLGTESPGKTKRKTTEGYELFEITIRGSSPVEGGTFEVFKMLDENGVDSYRYAANGDEFPPELIATLDKEKDIKTLYEPASVRTFTQSSGQVTTDCIENGWFKVCNAKECRKIDPCYLVGRYCDTCVVVPECHRDKLTKLTFVILDIAVRDEADPPSTKTQEVVAYVNSKGTFATSENDVAMKVTRDVPESTDLSKLFSDKEAASSVETENNSPQGNVLEKLFHLNPTSSEAVGQDLVPRKRLTRQPGSNVIQSRIYLDANAPE